MTVDEISNTGNTARSHTSNHPVSTLNTFVRRTWGVHRYETRCENIIELLQNFFRPLEKISRDFARLVRGWLQFLNCINFRFTRVILSHSRSRLANSHAVSSDRKFINFVSFFSSFSSLSISIYHLPIVSDYRIILFFGIHSLVFHPIVSRCAHSLNRQTIIVRHERVLDSSFRRMNLLFVCTSEF